MYSPLVIKPDVLCTVDDPAHSFPNQNTLSPGEFSGHAPRILGGNVQKFRGDFQKFQAVCPGLDTRPDVQSQYSPPVYRFNHKAGRTPTWSLMTMKPATKTLPSLLTKAAERLLLPDDRSHHQ